MAAGLAEKPFLRRIYITKSLPTGLDSHVPAGNGYHYGFAHDDAPPG